MNARAGRNTAKLRILKYLASAGGYVPASCLMKAGLVSIRSYRNVYSILGRLTKRELLSRKTGATGLAQWAITAKGKDRLDYYIRKGVGVTA
jgi:hypothetical protein